MASVSAPVARLLDARAWVPAAAVGLPLALLLARLLPADGVGLGLRIAAAAACVLLLPGGVVLRAVGSPALPSLAVAAALALSLAVVFAAFAVTFLVAGTIWLTVGAIAAVTAAAVFPATRAAAPPVERPEVVAFLLVCGGGVAFAAVVWWVSPSLETGDVLFHLGRARRLAETDVLSSVGVASEFADGGLHPGYAFPLWHGAIALIATLAGVDVGHVMLHLATLLVAPAFVAAYAAGRTLFDSWAGGIAVLAVQVAQLGFSRPDGGSFASLAGPSSITRVVLVPALLALAFAYLRTPSRRLLVPIAAASLAVVVVHPTYLVLLAIPASAFALLLLAFEPVRRRIARSLAEVAAAIAVPAGLFVAWLYPAIADQASHRTPEAERARALAHYGETLEVVGDSFRMAPETVTGRGPMIIAALACVPIAALAVRRRWGAFAGGGMLAALAVLMVPLLFTALSDLMLVSQARRLVAFLPVPFALAAAAVLVGRLRLVGVALALALGVAVHVLYGGSGDAAAAPTWPVWFALAGGALALVAGAALGPRLGSVLVPTRWAALVALAFVAPTVAAGLSVLERTPQRDPYGLTPGVIRALRELETDDVVFASTSTSHRVGAQAAVRLAATIPHHTADTGRNRPYRRQRDTIRFFAPHAIDDAERRAMLDRYGADYVLVDKTRPYPRSLVRSLPNVYEDGRYLLLRVPSG